MKVSWDCSCLGDFEQLDFGEWDFDMIVCFFKCYYFLLENDLNRLWSGCCKFIFELYKSEREDVNKDKFLIEELQLYCRNFHKFDCKPLAVTQRHL